MNGTADGISKDVITGESLTGLNKTKNGAFKMREENKNTSNSSVIRVHKNKNYTVMSNKHLYQKDLSLKAKGLMSVFLALPDDWNYSISGLCKIIKEGKDALNATISELKKFGYIDIERRNDKGGRFTFIYHIFEQGKSNLPYTVNPYTVEVCTENPNAVEPYAENPQQLNTKELNTNKQITNQLTFAKTDEAVFTCKDLFELYKSICIHFPQPRELTESRRLKAIKRLKENPKKEFWEEVFRKAEKSVFIRNNNFFSFDWILKNDTNALKVYEGRYNRQEIKEENSSDKYEGGKYAKCYG